MRTLLRSIALIILLALSVLPTQAKGAAEPDTVQVSCVNGFAVYADLVGAIQMFSSDHGQWEVGARINLKDKYFPAFEVGLGEADETDDYKDGYWCTVARAPYYRIGCDYNILRDKHDDYKLFLGLRYAFTSFNYNMTVLDDDAEAYVEYDDLHAAYQWLELVFGVDAKIWGPLHLGWDVRYRRALHSSHDSVGEPWYIPGFGNQKKAGFNLLFNFTLAI